MRPLEMFFILIVAGFLVAQNVRGIQRRYLFALAVVGLSTVLLSGLLGQVRWHMAPAYLLFGILSLLLLRRSRIRTSLFVRLASLSELCCSRSASLRPSGCRFSRYQAPSGPHVVGSTSLSLIDETRDNSFFGAPNEKRELYVQIWYPGAIATDQPTPRVRTMWEDLYRGDGIVSRCSRATCAARRHIRTRISRCHRHKRLTPSSSSVTRWGLSQSRTRC